MELVANVVVFAGTQAVRKRAVTGEATVRFGIEDALYEFIFKGWLQENLESMISDKAREVLTGDAANNFSSEDVYDALLKTLSIGVLDVIYKLAMSKQLNKSTFWYLVQVAGSFYVANIAQRQFRPDPDLRYRPQ